MTSDVPTIAVKQALPLLAAGRFEFLLRRAFRPLKLQKMPDAISPFDALKLAIYEWMQHLGDYVSDDQQQRIMDRFEPSLARNTGLYLGDELPLETVMLSFADRRYATWSRRESWYDFTQDVDCDELENPAVTLITCDVTALWMRLAARLKPQQRGDTYGSDVAAGNGRSTG